METENAAGELVQGPAWNLSAEYPSPDSAEFREDHEAVLALMDVLDAAGVGLAAGVPRATSLDPSADGDILAACREFAPRLEEARTLLGSLRVYVNCLASVDASDDAAKRLRGVLQSHGARLASAAAAYHLVLTACPDAFFDAFCGPGAAPALRSHRFLLAQRRKLRARTLPLESEKTLAAMTPDGNSAWGNLYNNLTGSLRCAVAQPDGSVKTMGLASAASLLKRPERGLREAAWRGINAAMAEHRESFASILNAISGWRFAEAGLRSHAEPVHYLDGALHQSRISRATLDAMMGAIGDSRELGRRALRAQARLYGVERLGPWDILAPAPARADAVAGGSGGGIPWDRGLATIRRAFAGVDPAMGAFVDAMAGAGRLEGRDRDGKRPGAYCTRFPKTRNPYVYTTYRGSLSELSTLAHELGHAYHGEVLRAVPIMETEYPMTLAETASTFAETVLGELLAAEAASGPEGAGGSGSSMLELAWSDAQDAATFLVNIPARFHFERSLYEARPSGPLGPDELRGLMGAAWAEWYGDSLSGYDEWYWASKLHFHMTEASFYNFPYSFGYLFSLGVYARRRELGPRFHEAYVGLLRDTGRMEAEELASRHLGADLTRPDFWLSGIRVVEEKVARFEALAAGAARG